jgi:hypothetical protein
VTGPVESPEDVPPPPEIQPVVAPLDPAGPAEVVVVIETGAIDSGPDGPAEVVVVVETGTIDPGPGSPAEAVAAAVLAVPGVVRLHGGRFGALGTYLPGRRVTGVRIDEEGTEVHVVVSDLVPVPDTAARVQRAVSAIAPMPVRVHVEDIDTIV